MSTWPNDEIRRIAETDDLHVSPLRDDGKSYGTPTWIWSVVVDDALYVRAYHGQSSRWYQAALRQKAGRITAAGMKSMRIGTGVNLAYFGTRARRRFDLPHFGVDEHAGHDSRIGKTCNRELQKTCRRLLLDKILSCSLYLATVRRAISMF